MLGRCCINRVKVQLLNAIFHKRTLNLVSALANQSVLYLNVAQEEIAWPIKPWVSRKSQGLLMWWLHGLHMGRSPEAGCSWWECPSLPTIWTGKFPGKGLKATMSLDFVSKLKVLVCLSSHLIRCLELLKNRLFWRTDILSAFYYRFAWRYSNFIPTGSWEKNPRAKTNHKISFQYIWACVGSVTGSAEGSLHTRKIDVDDETWLPVIPSWCSEKPGMGRAWAISS